MSGRVFTYLPLVFALGVTTVGCNVQFKNTPTNDFVVEDLEITGDYKIEQQGPEAFVKGTVSIQRREDMKFPYLIKYDLDGLPKDEMQCQTYRFGETNIAFVKYLKKGPARYFFAFGLEVSGNQVVAKPIDRAFFTDNPKKLAVVPGSGDDVVNFSESARLDLFFGKHQDSKSLFDHESPLILTRTKEEKD